MTSTTEAPPLASSHGVMPQNLAQLRRRARTGIWIEALGLVALLAIAFALPSFVTDRTLRLEWPFRLVLLASFLFVLLRTVQRRLLRPLAVALSDDEMALAVERHAPDVKQALISSLQFDRELRSGARIGESTQLMAAVVDDVQKRVDAIPFTNAIDAARVRRFAAAIVAGVCCFAAWGALSPATLSLWARRNVFLSNAEWPRYTRLAFAGTTDGQVRLPQGDPLTVRIAVEGPVPDQVFVDYAFRGGERGTEAMSRTGEREFAWTLDAVLGDVTLHAQGGDALPIDLAVTVVERPRIDDLSVRVVYPDYMEREPFYVPATEGEVRVPRGGSVWVKGKSQKPLEQAFLLFGADQKVALERDADGHGFGGGFTPTASGPLVVDVVDHDRLGAGAPPKLMLRVGDDKPPSLDFRLRGIGSSITKHARIPGDLKVKDDFGIREVKAQLRVTVETTADTKPDPTKPAPDDEPFTDVEAFYGGKHERSALRYETTAAVDLKPLSPNDKDDAAENKIRPGMLVSMRFASKDNFGPGDPHEGYCETMTFRVVTPDKLVEDLRRRQIEQRDELKRLIDEEQTALSEMREIVNPAQAGERRKVVEARLKALARQQQGLGRRVAFVGETYQRILWEYENNRLLQPNQVRDLEGKITVPLARIAKEAFPATSQRVDAFAAGTEEATRTAAVDGYTAIVRDLTAVMKEMQDAENLAAILETLRGVIKNQGSTRDEVEKRVKDREHDVFTPKKK